MAKKKKLRFLAVLIAAALCLCCALSALQGAGLEPGGSTGDVTGAFSILYYSSRDQTLTVKLDLEINEEPLSETGYDLDVEYRVYTNPVDPGEREMLKNERFTITSDSNGNATVVKTIILENPLPKAHILAWYVYDYTPAD